MRRFFGILAAAAFAAGGLAQDLTQKVTYTTVAVPVDRALHEIAVLAHVKLEAATDVQAEIVVIDVHDAVLNDLMKRIATATSCEWKKTASGLYRLYRPSEITRAEEDKEISARAAAIKKAVAKLIEPLEKHPVLDAKMADEILSSQPDTSLGTLTGASNGNLAGAARGVKALLSGGTDQPAGRATARLLAQIEPSVLANMEEGERVVFSTRPNRMQLALGRDSIGVLNTMVAEQGVWAEAYQRRNAGETKSDAAAAAAAAIGSFMGQANGPIQGTPMKALLCVQRQSMLESYELRLKLYDAHGKELFTGGQSMFLESSPLNRIEDFLKAQPPTADPEIELSDDSKELLGFFRGMTAALMGGATAKDLSAELLAKLRNPDKHDPLGFIHSEALIAAADASKANLVADVPDSMMGVAAGFMTGQKLTVAGFLKALSSGDSVSLETKDGWMVVKPTRPVRERSRRVDRAALAQLIAVAQAKGMIPLDNLAAYALKNAPLTSSEVCQLYAILFLPGAGMKVNVGGMGEDWDMLRFYGSLTLSQRRGLGNGGSIQLRALTPYQAELVKRLTYYPGMMGSGLTARQPAQSQAGPTLPAVLGGPSNEPTEMLPNGLPPDGMITVATKNDTVVKDAGAKQPKIQLFSSLGAPELGTIRSLKDDPHIGALLGSFLPDLAQFRVGTRVNYSFTFQYTPEISMQKLLQDSQFDPDSPVLTYQNLPEDFRKQVEEMQAQMKKMGGMGSIFGGGSPAKP